MTNWKSWLWPGALVVFILTLSAGWFTSPSVEAELTRRTTSLLIENGQNWADVQLDGRDLTIRGIAPNEAAIETAQKLATKAYDVRIVSNQTQLLAAQSPYNLSALLEDGKLTLSGYVADEAEKLAVIAAANSALPDVSVVEEIKLARGQPENYLQANKFGLSQLSKFSSGNYNLQDTTYNIKGFAKTSGNYEAAISEISNGLPANFTVSTQSIMAPHASPYLWNSQLEENTLTLSGLVPDHSSQKAVLDIAHQNIPVKTINNNMAFASGQPEGFSNAVKFGLALQENMTSAKFSIKDTELSVSAQAKSKQDHDHILELIRTEIPEGYTMVTQEISFPVTKPYTWSAKLTNDTISLAGFVPTEESRQEVHFLTKQQLPGIAISDQLVVADGAPNGFAKATNLGISTLSNFSKGIFSLQDTKLSVSGKAISHDKFGAALSLLTKNVPTGFTVIKQEITPPTAKPYAWGAKLSADKILLSGFVPDEITRANIIATASRKNPNKKIEDSMIPAAGAPVGFEKATDFALSILPKFSTGEVSLSDEKFSVSGVAESISEFDATSLLLNKNIPTGFKTVTRQITRSEALPYLWSAIKTDTTMTLSGYAPNTESIENIVDDASSNNPGATIVNNMKVANGAPDGFSSSTKFTQILLSKLSNGSANYVDGNLIISGQASSVQNYGQAIQMNVPTDVNLVNLDISPARISPFELHITKNDKNLLLDGVIPSEESRTTILAAIAKIGKQMKVSENLNVAAGTPIGVDWDKAADFGLTQLQHLASGKVDMLNINFSIRGVADKLEGYKQVRAALRAGVAGGMTLANEDIKPPLKSPYVWNAARNGNHVILDGFVPSIDVADKNAQTVKSNLGQNAVIENKLSPGSGAQLGFAKITNQAINLIGRLENSRAFILNNSLAISGEALSQQAANAIKQQLKDMLPDNFAGKTNITVRKVKQSQVVKPDVCQALLNSLQSDNTIHFEFAKYTIRPESFGLLDRLVFTAKRCPGSNISIEGHTDQVGSHRYNQELSEKRAFSTAQYLVENGISKNRIGSIGFGETRQLFTDGQPESDAKNRRIEFKILN